MIYIILITTVLYQVPLNSGVHDEQILPIFWIKPVSTFVLQSESEPCESCEEMRHVLNTQLLLRTLLKRFKIEK